MSIPRESKEFVRFRAFKNGIPVVDGVKYNLTKGGDRPLPTDWKDPDKIDDTTLGFLSTGLAVGNHHVWIQFTSNPEIPVRYAGKFSIS